MGSYLLAEYQRHLLTAGDRLDPLVEKTMQRAGLNIRDEWRVLARGKNRKHAPKYASTIRMERLIAVGNEVTVTVSPGWYGQGPLAAVLERGSPTSRPQMSDVEAMNKEAPRLAKWLNKAAADNIR